MKSKGIIHFTVSKMMNVVGIGYIITGHTDDGTVRPGATIVLSEAQPAFVIDAVEKIEYAEADDIETALILEPIANDSAELFHTISPGQVLILINP